MSDIKQSQSPPPSVYAGVTGGAAAAGAGAGAGAGSGLGPNSVVLSKQLKPNVGAPGVVAEKVLAPQIDVVQPKKTKIVATLGPASSSVDVLSKLIASGVDVFRLNMSHGAQETHAQTAKNIREAVKVAGRAVAIMADLQGPKFRTGLIDSPTKKVLVKKGDTVDVITSDLRPGFLGTAQCVASGTAHADVMVREVGVGHRILINDGAVVLRVVKRVSKQQVTCVVLVGGDVGEKKGMNVPELKVPIPAITDKDAKDAVFALSLEVDFVALSFVQRPEDITQLKELLEANIKADPKNPSRVPRIPKIIAKIEKPQAIDDIDSILAVVDVIMVARGDLGVECSLESVPVYQKLLIEKANKALVPVITATQMLESMITNASPTRAEVSDVANAVFDGTDAVMLSGESAMGAYPVEAVQMMASIVETAERSIRQKALQPAIAAAAAASAASGAAAGSGGLGGVGVASPIHRAVSGRDAVHHPHMQMHLSFPSAEFMHHAMALSAHVAAQGLQARAIVAICLTYDMACYVSKLRSLCPVVAVTPSARLFRVFQLNYGLVPVHMPSQNAKDKNITSSDAYIVEMERTLKAALPQGVLAPGELYIFVSGTSPVPGLTHSMQALRFGEAAKQMHAVAAPAAK